MDIIVSKPILKLAKLIAIDEIVNKHDPTEPFVVIDPDTGKVLAKATSEAAIMQAWRGIVKRYPNAEAYKLWKDDGPEPIAP